MIQEIDPKTEMINEIIFLTKISEELWQYHPNNPDRINVEDEYQRINTKITNLQTEIQKLSK
ncbi:MAG: hypothetical protein ACPHP2_14725 [Limisphaerales bacterium]